MDTTSPTNKEMKFRPAKGDLPAHWERDNGKEIHVMPKLDTLQHTWRGCPCNPALEKVPTKSGDNGALFIHNKVGP